MALQNTTLAAACAATDKTITVASATNLVAGLIATVGGGSETMMIAKSYTVGSVTVPVLRALDGGIQLAHPTSAQVSFYLLASDYLLNGPQLSVTSPLAGRLRYPSEVTTSAAWVPRADNQDEYVELNGTSVIALTLTNPLRSQSGKIVTFAANGIAAHTITYTTVGFGNVGGTADVITFGTTQAQTFVMIAVGGFWCIYAGLSTATANVSGPAIT